MFWRPPGSILEAPGLDFGGSGLNFPRFWASDTMKVTGSTLRQTAQLTVNRQNCSLSSKLTFEFISSKRFLHELNAKNAKDAENAENVCRIKNLIANAPKMGGRQRPHPEGFNQFSLHGSLQFFDRRKCSMRM